MPTSSASGLATIEPDDLAEQFPGTSDPDAMEAFQANIGDEDISIFDLAQIKVPGSGGTTWEVEGLVETESVRDLRGVILAILTRRAYYESSYDDTGGGTAPDCASSDGKTGRGLYGVGSESHPSGSCEDCDMNEWTDDGKGKQRKPCTEQRLLVFLREGSILPMIIQVPPTSLKPLKQFMIKMVSSGVPYHRAVANIALKKVDGKQPYSVLVFTLDAKIPTSLAAPFKEMGDQMKAIYLAQAGSQVALPNPERRDGGGDAAALADAIDAEARSDGGIEGITADDLAAARAEAAPTDEA